MMSVKSSSSLGEPSTGPIVRSGYLKKLKTSKRKFFVLRAETCDCSARLEYYDTEKKFRSGQIAKRSIPLRTCFNINKRSDTKYKHVIALYTKDDRFCVVLESEEDQESWLKALISLQQGEELPDGEKPRPTFEHVWQVTLLSRGLGASEKCFGFKIPDGSIYRLCLTDQTLSLIRMDDETLEMTLTLNSIRSCGSLKNFFYLEAGRSSLIGAGELWMDCEDGNIAQNVHQTVIQKCSKLKKLSDAMSLFNSMSANSSSSREELAPKSRNRSSSATESSKPNAMPRRQTTSGAPKPNIYQQAGNSNNVAWPGTVSHQRTRSLPLAHPAPLNTETTTTTITNTTTFNPVRTAAKRSTNQSSKCFNDSRVRCDSMPSRPRTTSEGHHHSGGGGGASGSTPVWEKMASYLMPHRPQSMHVRDFSHSPPSGSPVSPPSAACSTDSAGSSLSIDESEPWHDDLHRRFPTSLTPDEAIAEENCDDCTDSPCMVHSSPTTCSYLRMAPISSDDGYVDMSPKAKHTAMMSPAASMSSVTSGTPSTDMRFAEYPLEKVASYLTRSEEEETNSTERPRTYSMGSRPYKSRMDQVRDRAWSVGSKSKKFHGRVLPPHGGQPHTGAKSSSAPLLSNSRLHSSHSSVDPMDDLMEMDFSKNSGYMDMRPGIKTCAGYVVMRPGHIEKPVDTSPYVDMRPGSSPAKSTFVPSNESQRTEISRPGYMDMDNRRSSKVKPSTSPMISVSPISSLSSTSPMSQYTPQSEYCDMSFQPKNAALADSYQASPVKSTLSGYFPNIPSADNMDSYYSMSRPSNNDGYVEMSLGNNKPQLLSSSSCSDYTNMSLGSKKKDRKSKETGRSQPITIQNSVSQAQKPSGFFSRQSISVSPKILPPSNSSSTFSFARQRSRKNSRRDSRDSSSSSVTTPSSSSTIFPISLNSPTSPSATTTATTTVNSISSSSSRNVIKIPAAILKAKYTQSSTGFRSDYTSMDFDRRKSSGHQQPSDYVNCDLGASSSKTKSRSSADSAGDYAVMKPGVLDKSESPSASTSMLCTQLTVDLSFKPINDDYFEFEPSTSNALDSRLFPNNDTALLNNNNNNKLSRPSSESSEVSTIVGSRPSSVNSDKIQQQLHYASLDLPPVAINDDDSSKSPRQPKDQSSGGAQETQSDSTKLFDYVEIEFNKNNQLLANAKH